MTRNREVNRCSFGIQRGSLIWIDRYDGNWWGVFAHYEEFEDQTGKDKPLDDAGSI